MQCYSNNIRMYFSPIILLTSKSTIMNKENSDGQDYNISFFKPTTKLARANRNLIIVLLIIWGLSIFGFQTLLRIVEKPTPEIAYTQYTNVWQNVKSGTASIDENRVYVKSLLSVLGKLTIATEDRSVLNSSVSEITNILSENNQDFNTNLTAFKTVEFGDDNYNTIKGKLIPISADLINVPAYSLEAKLLPIELRAANNSITDTELVPKIMKKYLIHNQSFITDYVFLGFPFHYFYTAVFLLVLFVGICLYYCIAIERILKNLNISED